MKTGFGKFPLEMFDEGVRGRCRKIPAHFETMDALQLKIDQFAARHFLHIGCPIFQVPLLIFEEKNGLYIWARSMCHLTSATDAASLAQDATRSRPLLHLSLLSDTSPTALVVCVICFSSTSTQH
jgi:hypothetical protein